MRPPRWLISLLNLRSCETSSREGRLQQPVAAKMSGRSPQRSVKSRTVRSLPGTLHRTRIFCSLSSPLWIVPSVLQLWPLLSRATEGPCPLECPHQQCHSVLTRNQENYGLLSVLLCWDCCSCVCYLWIYTVLKLFTWHYFSFFKISWFKIRSPN